MMMYSYNQPERGILLTVSLVLVTLGVVLLLAGYASPGWKYYHGEGFSGSVSLHLGLWYYVFCSFDMCDSGNIGSLGYKGKSVK